jgi:protein required for attachment to host cells
MSNSWIVSANAGRVRFFSKAYERAPYQEVADFINESAHLRTTDTESDELGRLSSAGGGRNGTMPDSGYQPNQSPAEHQTELFARSVAESLLQAYDEGQFKQVTLVASPEFLGMLRKQLDPRIKAKVVEEINKDYTQLNAAQLRQQIDSLH